MDAEQRLEQLVKAAEEAVEVFNFEAPAAEFEEYAFPADLFGLDNPTAPPDFG